MKSSRSWLKLFKKPEPNAEVLAATAAARAELMRITAMVKAEGKAQRLRDEADHEVERWNDQHGG